MVDFTAQRLRTDSMVKMSRVGYWLTVVFLSSGLFCLGCGHKATTPTNQIQQVFETGDWEATVALCDQTLQEHPNNVDALTFRGRAYVADGQYFKGIEDFTTVVELQPDDAEGYYHREIAYRLAGKTEQADVDGQRGRELDTLYKSAYAYEPSSFRSISTSSSNPYVEPIYADEASFQANDPTSRLLAADTSTEPAENETLESRVGQDVVIPQVPKVDRTNGIPKLKGTETAKTDEADAPKDAAEVEEIEGIQFPPQPLADTPNDSDLPNIDNPFVNPPPPISTSLPIGPAGNLFIPGAPLRGVVGTGLPTARTSGGATGTSSLRPQGLSFGRSGLPIPNNTTGLPMSSPLSLG
jgi:hypothetical protein